MKIALVHDQLQEFGGAERVLVELHKLFPDAEVYTAFYSPQSLGNHKQKFEDWTIHTSWADKIPFLKKVYSPLRFITPRIWESFDFSKYDMVISSSGSFMCKGIITGKKTTHICYLHHPPRYLYHYETGSLNELQRFTLFRIYASLINHFLRIWDYSSSQRPDYYIVNSEETKKRTEKFYRRDSTVIYPPVQVPTPFSLKKADIKKRGYYLTVSRLQYAKHVDLLVRAANKGKFNLKVVGVGRDLARLQKIAGPTVEFLSSVPDEKMQELYRGAKAFLFASVDDEFGIAPIEAMGRGIPVIAYASGGLKETVTDGKNGYLYKEFAADLIVKEIEKMERLSEDNYFEMCINARTSSEKYTVDVFRKKLLAFIKNKT